MPTHPSLLSLPALLLALTNLPHAIHAKTPENTLPALSIAKHSHRDAERLGLRRRSDVSNLGVGRRQEGLGRRQGDGITGVEGVDGTVGTNVFDVVTWSTGGAYYTNVTVGTPPQPQVVILDTGSSDLYFDASSAPACESSGPYSCRGGTFTPSDSSSYEVVDPAPAFDTQFGDGSSASGPFGTDVIGIGGVLIDDVQFGVAENVNSTTGYAVGLLGLGYSANEASNEQYPNLPEVLSRANVTNSRLYSVFLNSEAATSGTILFGGIDRSKFSGPLETLNFLPSDPNGYGGNGGYVYQFISAVTALSATTQDGSTQEIFSGGSTGVEAYDTYDASLPVLLDTGSTAWSFPASLYNRYIDPFFPFVDSSSYCACSHRQSAPSLTLTFGGAVDIEVPAQDFIVPVYDPETNEAVKYDNGTDACAFLIIPTQPTGYGFHILGDAILRSVYAVFDLDQGQVSLAQAKTDSDDEPDIVAVEAGEGGVARAVQGTDRVASNSYTILPGVSATVSYEASAAASTVGTATGINAVPTIARPEGWEEGEDRSSSGSGSGSGSDSGSGSGESSGGNDGGSGTSSGDGSSQTSDSAASSLNLGAWCDMGVATSLAVVGAFAVLGAALVL